MTIVLTTHYMEEAQEMADRVAVMSGGRIVAEGTPATLGGRDSAKTRITYVTAEGPVTVETTDPTATLRELIWAGVVLDQLTVERPSLEDVYLELTGS